MFDATISVLDAPSGIFLPGTELLQSPFRMEFQSGKVILPTDIDISHMSAKNSEE